MVLLSKHNKLLQNFIINNQNFNSALPGIISTPNNLSLQQMILSNQNPLLNQNLIQYQQQQNLSIPINNTYSNNNYLTNQQIENN